MVEIVEETSDAENSGPSTSRARNGSGARQNQAQFVTISQFVSTHTLVCGMFAARVLTVFFSFSYFLPFLSIVSPASAYHKAFAAAAATFALRLHQRLNGFSFSREFLMSLVVEDSFHYLIYSVVFLMASPMSMALLPVSLYASLQAASFLVKVMKETGNGHSGIVLRLEQFVQTQTQNCLGIIACAEIFLVPLLVSMILTGKASLLLPFVYYRFLTLRYASRRNPSTRQAFSQMRASLDQVAGAPACPQPVRLLIQNNVIAAVAQGSPYLISSFEPALARNNASSSRRRGHPAVRVLPGNFVIMAIPNQLLICSAIKVLIVLLTIVVLILLDPAYVTAYISINYEIVLIYIVCALTLLYCIVSVIMYFMLTKRGEDTPMTNCALSEVIFATAGIMGWLIIIGIGGTISQRTIIETGERFGWIGAMAGLNTGCFLGIAAIFALNVINEKILQRRNRYGKYDRGYVR
ncbi:unnamed protein product [Caenorhabditis auriculariae]|uniref:Uncharacterized protein n=1 Tax=Caenorhabditis auriculariae TaxID=2777116 RepID=A0A8S1H050_9PELO|nr:unnamed protein product [Caenorhabditis auriculariae]